MHLLEVVMAPDGYYVNRLAGLTGIRRRRRLKVFRRPDYFIANGVLITLDNTEAAPLAFLGGYKCLEFLGARTRPHLNGVELASLDTVLTTLTLVFIHHGQEPVGRHQVESLIACNREEVLTTTVAAIAVSPVNEPGIFGFKCNIDSFC